MPADWAAIRLEYVHGTENMRDLAAKHKIKAAGLMKRAAKEQWESERQQKSAEVSKAVSGALIEARIDELSQYNADDLAAAKAIRSAALAMLDTAATPNDIRSISGAVDIASKVARLALGASTENSTVTTKELPASVEDFV